MCHRILPIDKIDINQIRFNDFFYRFIYRLINGCRFLSIDYSGKINCLNINFTCDGVCQRFCSWKFRPNQLLEISEESNEELACLNSYVYCLSFHGSPFDDEIWMGESKHCVVKNDGGNNNYVIYLSDERDFTHTIIEDSETLGQIYLVRKRYYGGGQYEQHKNDDIGFDEETKTIVTFMRDSRGKHKFTGRIIIRRSKPGNVAEMKLYLVEPKSLIKVQIRCKLRSLDIEELGCSSERSLQHYKRAFGSNINDRPVPSVPFHYRFNTDVEADPIPGLCGILSSLSVTSCLLLSKNSRCYYQRIPLLPLMMNSWMRSATGRHNVSSFI